jgi:hypothetical protein
MHCLLTTFWCGRGALANGTSILREYDVPERFTCYHVELDDHALILAENAPAETC